MTPGTVLPAVRARLIELLVVRLPDVAVGYHPPQVHVDLTAPLGGPLEAVWLMGTAETAGVGPVALGSPVLIEEDWTQTVVTQVLGRDTSQPQESLDERCGEILGEVMEELALNPRLDLDLDGWGKVTATPQAWRWQSGVLLRSSRTETANARVELDVRIEASRC